MLYVFRSLRTPWCKIGYTGQPCPWDRLYPRGFWGVLHPTDLCGHLDPEDFELLTAFEGGRDLESALQSLFPPDRGEFWRAERVDTVLAMLRLMARELDALPPRPSVGVLTSAELQPCCGGRGHRCYRCGATYARYHRLQQHIADAHRRVRVRCACGLEIVPRNLLRHQRTSCPLRSEAGAGA